MKKHIILISAVIIILTFLLFGCSLASTADDSGSSKKSKGSKSSSLDTVLLTETTSTEDTVSEDNQTITEDSEENLTTTEETKNTEELVNNTTDSSDEETNQDYVDQQDIEDDDSGYILSEDLSGKSPDYYIVPVNGGDEIALPDNSIVNLKNYDFGVYVNNNASGKFKIEAYFTLNGEIEKYETFHINILNEQNEKTGFINLKNRGYKKIIAYGIVNLKSINQKIIFSWDQNSGKKQDKLEEITVNLELNYIKIYVKKNNGNKKNK